MSVCHQNSRIQLALISASATKVHASRTKLTSTKFSARPKVDDISRSSSTLNAHESHFPGLLEGRRDWWQQLGETWGGGRRGSGKRAMEEERWKASDSNTSALTISLARPSSGCTKHQLWRCLSSLAVVRLAMDHFRLVFSRIGDIFAFDKPDP